MAFEIVPESARAEEPGSVKLTGRAEVVVGHDLFNGERPQALPKPLPMAGSESVIKVVGVGSGGVNAVNTMIGNGIAGIDYIAVNTDMQDLQKSLAPVRIVLDSSTGGRGAGGDPEKAAAAAMEKRKEIESALRDAQMVVLATGLGGGTGTGATPVIGDIARQMGILTVAVATMPFKWDGRVKALRAATGLDQLRDKVDAYFTISNDKMLKAFSGVPTGDAFRSFDGVLLCEAVEGVVDLVTRPGIINLDIEDVRTALENRGACVICSGVGEGAGRAEVAAESALHNPLLDDSPVNGARNILVNIVQGPTGTIDDIGIIMNHVLEMMDPDCFVKTGFATDPSLGEKVKVTIVASGIDVTPIVPAELSVIDGELDFQSGARPIPFAEAMPVQQGSGIARKLTSGMERLGFSVKHTQNEVNVDAGMLFSNVGGSEFDAPAYSRQTGEMRAFPAGSGKIDVR